MTLDPPHMVVRNDALSVNSPYWQQAPFNIASGIGFPGVNPYGPDEGTPGITVPFSPAQARHAGKANVVFLDGHVEGLTLNGLGVRHREPNPAPLDAGGPCRSPGRTTLLWTGRGLDEFS